MSRRCFMVYPLPSVADESFLNVIFDGGVCRSVFAGFGPRRFALVELRDDARAEAVTSALGPMPSPHVNTHTSASSLLKDKEDDCGLEKLGSAPVAAASNSRRKGNAAGRKKDGGDPTGGADSDGCTGPSGIAYISRLRFRNTPIQVLPSPITLDEIYRCGGQLPQRCSGRKTESDKPQGRVGRGPLERKRQRPPATEETTTESENAAMAGGGTTTASNVDACRRCGSAEHFTRQCSADLSTEDADGKRGEAAGATTGSGPRGTSPRKRAAKHVFPADCCQKCGSSLHFTRHCDADAHSAGESARPQDHTGLDNAAAAHTVVPKKQEKAGHHEPPNKKKEKQQQKQEQRHVALCTSKDHCKHCGSDAHFSRHCPSK
ncbi:hypothetical protein BCY84_01969 [Trypanosoma cruzi cruzi]|nr:hypothetical protein BCY84_01969 [Trypanosoma cruzi cruzi]